VFAYVGSAPHTKVDPTGQFVPTPLALIKAVGWSAAGNFAVQALWNYGYRKLSLYESVACVDYMHILVSGGFRLISPGWVNVFKALGTKLFCLILDIRHLSI
jgi:hypothetical protein